MDFNPLLDLSYLNCCFDCLHVMSDLALVYLLKFSLNETTILILINLKGIDVQILFLNIHRDLMSPNVISAIVRMISVSGVDFVP